MNCITLLLGRGPCAPNVSCWTLVPAFLDRRGRSPISWNWYFLSRSGGLSPRFGEGCPSTPFDRRQDNLLCLPRKQFFILTPLKEYIITCIRGLSAFNDRTTSHLDYLRSSLRDPRGYVGREEDWIARKEQGLFAWCQLVMQWFTREILGRQRQKR